MTGLLFVGAFFEDHSIGQGASVAGFLAGGALVFTRHELQSVVTYHDQITIAQQVMPGLSEVDQCSIRAVHVQQMCAPVVHQNLRMVCADRRTIKKYVAGRMAADHCPAVRQEAGADHLALLRYYQFIDGFSAEGAAVGRNRVARLRMR